MADRGVKAQKKEKGEKKEKSYIDAKWYSPYQ